LASVANHLTSAASAAGLELVIEQLGDRGDAWKAATTRAEATIFGPNTRESSPGLYRVHVDVFVTVTTHRQTDASAWVAFDKAGAMARALDQCILIRRYDELDTPDPEVIGELVPRSENNDQISVEGIKPTKADQLNHIIVRARLVGHDIEGA
jgi:hypothetical protein